MTGKSLEKERLKSHRTSLGTFAAADTVRLRLALCLLRSKEEQRRCSFQCRSIEVGNGFTHHRAAADNLDGIIRSTAHLLDDIRKRSTHTYKIVVLPVCRNTSSGHCYGIVNDRLVLLDSIVDGQCSSHVLNDRTYIDRKRS